MPKLLVFTPCERIIISSDDNSATLIALMNSLQIEMKSGARDKVTAPLAWSIFTMWYRQPEDADVVYHQRVELVSPPPDNEVLVVADSEFQMTVAYHRQMQRTFGLPIAGNGIYTLRLSIKPATTDKYKVVAEFPWQVNRTEVASPARQ